MIRTWAVYLRSILITRRRLIKTIIGMILSPLLYAVAFGWGVGSGVEMEGVPYLQFMLPGLAALTTMNQSFSIGSEINVARFYNKQFEEFLLAPMRPHQIVNGFVFFGLTKGMFSFVFITAVGYIVGAASQMSPLIIVPVVLNCFLFSSLGVFIALTVKSHRDMNSFNAFVIIPMSFVAGTFFSLERLPNYLQIAAKIIPLTYASGAIRDTFLSRGLELYQPLVLAGFGIVFYILAVRVVQKAVD